MLGLRLYFLLRMEFESIKFAQEVSFVSLTQTNHVAICICSHSCAGIQFSGRLIFSKRNYSGAVSGMVRPSATV